MVVGQFLERTTKEGGGDIIFRCRRLTLVGGSAAGKITIGERRHKIRGRRVHLKPTEVYYREIFV